MANMRLPLALWCSVLLPLAVACSGNDGRGRSASLPASPTATSEAIAAPTLPAASAPATPPAGLIDRMTAHLSATTGQPLSAFTLVLIESQVWPDGCLGLGKGDSACSQALVPGWLAVFRDGAGVEYRYRAGPGHFVLEQ